MMEFSLRVALIVIFDQFLQVEFDFLETRPSDLFLVECDLVALVLGLAASVFAVGTAVDVASLASSCC